MTNFEYSADTKLEAHDFQVYLEDLPTPMLLALAQHGFKQKLGDAAAMTKEEKAELWSDAAIAEKVRERREAIVQNLLDGKWAAGGTTGPRLRGFDAIVRDVAVEQLKAAFAAKKLKWPSGKGSAEQISGLVEKLVAKNGDAIRAEAKRREAAAQADSILDDILA
jgi:hypothetical protein